MARVQVSLPYNWSARPYQLGVWRAMDEGKRRGVLVWHRRAGKDMTCLHRTVIESQRRRANYYHVLPTYNQGRKVVWQGKDKTGKPFIHAWPKELVNGDPNNTEMRIELINGSTWQVVGGDQIDRIVGVNLGGVVFSEWSLTNPLAYEYMRPILRENNAWALFPYTPRGKNHGWDLYTMAQQDPDWFCERLTVDDTGVISKEDIEADRREGMSEELIQQEYYCDFGSGVVGSIYGRSIARALDEGRIGVVLHNPSLPVHTAWDLGYDDSTAIWFFQVHGNQVYFINYLEHRAEGLRWYAERLDDLREEHGYRYGQHFGPHDLEQHDVSTGRTRKSIASDLGVNFVVIPRIKVQMEGIEASRTLLPMCWIDAIKCKHGIMALENYRYEYNEERKVFTNLPVHDWSSHGAKAFETAAFAVKKVQNRSNGISQEQLNALYLKNAPPSVRAAYGR
jgi:phage terminase large subunit